MQPTNKPEREKEDREAERIDRLPLALQQLAIRHQLDQYAAEPSLLERHTRAVRASSLRVS